MPISIEADHGSWFTTFPYPSQRRHAFLSLLSILNGELDMSLLQFMHIHFDLFTWTCPYEYHAPSTLGVYFFTDHTLNGRHRSCRRRLDSWVLRVV